MEISELSASINESMTLAISAKAKELKKQGKQIIGFTAGEPDFDTPNFVKVAASKAICDGFTKYTPASGMKELKEAICNKLKRDNGLDYEPSQVVVSTGAKSAIYHALLAVVNPDDEVIIPVPYWLTYPEQVKLARAKSVFVDTRKTGYKLTKSQLEKAITKKTKCLILNSPSNPTGAMYSYEELCDIAEVCVKNNIFVISDEIYEKLSYGKKHISIASINEQIKDLTIVVNGVSKAYSMTGWRIGYTASNKQVAKAISNVQSHTTSNACSIAQYASVTAINDGEQFCIDACNIFAARRLLMIEFAKKLQNVSYAEPDGAFYIFINVSAYYGKSYEGTVINGSMDFAKCLLDYGVAVIPGLPFGDDESIRLSYAVSETDIVLGFTKIVEFMSKLC